MSAPWRLSVVGSWIVKKTWSRSLNETTVGSKVIWTTSAWPVVPVQTSSYDGFAACPPAYPDWTFSTPFKSWKAASRHQKHPPARVTTSRCGTCPSPFSRPYETSLSGKASSRPQRAGCQGSSGDAGCDLGERRLAVGGGVVAEGREPAVVRRSKPVERDVLRCFEHAVPDLLRRLHPRVDRVDHADENPLARLDVLFHEAKRPAAVRLARALDVEVGDLQLEQRGQELRVVHVGAVRRVAIAARAGVDSHPAALFRREALQHLVVQLHEHREQALRGIELHGEPALGEIELHDVGALREATTDVPLRLAHQILEKRFARISLDAVLRIEQAQRRGCNHRLLDRHVRVRSCAREICIGVRLIAERPGGQPGELPRVAVGEGDGDAIRREIREPVDRVRGEAGFRLLPVGDDGGLGCLETLDGIADRRVLEASELIAREATGGELLHARDEVRGSGDAANGLCGNRHRARLAAAGAMSMTLSPILRLRGDATKRL